MRKAALATLMVGALACGGDDAGGGVDAGPGGTDASTELPTTCTGECAQLGLTASFGSTTRGFDRAFFGLTSPAKSGSGQWEVHVESYGGGEDACPSMSSPTPDRTAVITGFEVPTALSAVMDGSTSLLDFEGALLPDPPPTATATSHTIAWVAADPCVPCAEGTEADRASRFVAFDLVATFLEGSLVGRVYATHCDSLDDL